MIYSAMQVGRIGLALLLLLASTQCTPQYQVASQDTQTYSISSRGASADADLETLLEPYRTQLKATMDEVIAEVAKPLAKERPESTLGNLVADALLDYSREHVSPSIDLAMLNHGGIRIPSLEKGVLKVGKVFELMPFDNMITVLNMKGSVLQLLLDKIAAEGGWPTSRGLSMVIHGRTAGDIQVNGQSLDPDKDYLVALPDFVANGGSNCHFLIEVPRIEVEPKLVRDIFIEQFREMGAAGPLTAEVEGRITRATL